MNDFHQPVLLKESSDFLVNQKQGFYFDATMGFGGHLEKFLNILSPDSTIVSTDVDAFAFNSCKEKFGKDKRVRLYNFNFTKIDVISKIESIKGYNGIFADLGVSSFQIDDPSEGFTFRTQAPLDLRMDKTKKISAADLVNTLTEEELVKILFQYGEEKNAKKIARRITDTRKIKPIKTTLELVELITKITPQKYLTKTLSRVFQAIRIAVNDELENLKLFLNKAVDLLLPGGRLVVISYHSLEDRIVKDIFKYESLSCICPADFPVCRCDKFSTIKILTRKPVTPSPEEIKSNNRARSAKLRVAEKV